MINDQLSLTNKSNHKISVLYSNRAKKKLTENNIAYYTSDYHIIQPDSSRDITILGGENAWHQYIDEGKTKTLFVYVFDTDSLKTLGDAYYSMDELITQGKYLKILSYSEKELNEIDWKIRFQ